MKRSNLCFSTISSRIIAVRVCTLLTLLLSLVRASSSLAPLRFLEDAPRRFRALAMGVGPPGAEVGDPGGPPAAPPAAKLG